MIYTLTKKQIVILLGLVLFALLVTGVGTALYIQRGADASMSLDVGTALHARGAAVTNGPECAVIARDIIYKGGSAVDAGIATSLCEGISMAQSMGIGGGFFATIYIRKTGEVYTLNARETAPSRATKEMFYGNPEASKTGALAVGIPGDIRGYQQLHQRFGILPWKELFQPTIKLCRSGLLINDYLDQLYVKNRDFLKNSDDFSEFIDPKTGEPYRKGARVKRLKLAETLEIIASEPDALHKGSLTKGFISDIERLGGIISEDDMNNYKPVWKDPIVMPLKNNYTLYTFPPPGSGAVLAQILGLLQDHLELDLIDKVVNWQRILESFKFAYGMKTKLGDPTADSQVDDVARKMISPECIADTRKKMHDDSTSQDPAYYGAQTRSVDDHGTAHINVLAPNGDAFAFTGTINLIFGAKIVSNTTGIILNDEMDDFVTQPYSADVPWAPTNEIAPGKRPMSSMCPSVILDRNGDVRLLVGGAGGTKITTATALVTLRHLNFGQPVADAIAGARMHHQTFPMQAIYDPEFGASLLDGLRSIGHRMLKESPDGFGAVTAVSNDSGIIEAASDTRRVGSMVMI